MTRINLVPPEELCDQHLLAEHRELMRIPNAVARGFKVQDFWPQDLPSQADLCQDYVPTDAALAANRARIRERMPAQARFTPHRNSD